MLVSEKKMQKNMTTIDILNNLLIENNNIFEFTFCAFPKQKLLQDSIKFEEIENVHFQEALKIRDKFHLPFWDSIMLTYFDKENTSDSILESALRHNFPFKKFTSHDIAQLKHESLLTTDYVLAVNSAVLMKNGEIKHILLLDFHIPISESNCKQVIKVLKCLGLNSGFVLESGESYHYVGKEIISYETLVNLLIKSLFFSPIIDRTWIAHQLIEKSCSLRIGYKHNVEPKLIYELNGN